jgi:hypothetical protein
MSSIISYILNLNLNIQTDGEQYSVSVYDEERHFNVNINNIDYKEKKSIILREKHVKKCKMIKKN